MGELFGQRLVLALAADGQIAPLGGKGRCLVAVGRNGQLVGDAACQRARQIGALLERDARDGDQRQHVGGAHAGVGAVVAAHVDQLRRPLHAPEGRLDHRFGFTHEGDDRAVGRLARIDVEQLDALDRLDRRRNLADYSLVAPLAEVGDALHDTFCHMFV